MPKQILIYGVPGAGKTTAGTLVESQLQLPLISGDYLREVAQGEHTKEEAPFAYYGTCQAWANFGELNKEHAVIGLKAVRDAMRPYVSKVITFQTGYIFEVAFLDPNDYRSKATLCLVTTRSKEKHREQFFRNRKVTEETTSEFMAARLVQEYLINEAQQNHILIIDNVATEQVLSQNLSISFR